MAALKKSILLLALVAALTPTRVAAEQVIPTHIEYSNDEMTEGGVLRACIVTVVVLSGADPLTLNFQLLAIKGRMAWKITGGLVDRRTTAITPLRATDGSFSSSSFMMPTAFVKSTTPEGQLVGVLTQTEKASTFLNTFFETPFSVEVKWIGVENVLNYYIESPPSGDIRNKFDSCLQRL